jgi:hypothetical protein
VRVEGWREDVAFLAFGLVLDPGEEVGLGHRD